MSIAESIRNIRLKAFLTQEEFAKEVGVSFATVNRWEQGRRRPNFSAVNKMRTFCGKHRISSIDLETAWLAATLPVEKDS